MDSNFSSTECDGTCPAPAATMSEDCDGTCPPQESTMSDDCDGTCDESPGKLSLAQALGEFYAPLLDGDEAHQALLAATAAYQDACEQNSNDFARARDAAAAEFEKSIAALMNPIGVALARLRAAEAAVNGASAMEALSTAGDTKVLKALAQAYNAAVAEYELVLAVASAQDKTAFNSAMSVISEVFQFRQLAASEALAAAGMGADAALTAAFAAHAEATARKK